jgi:hypothetical protein
MTKVNSLREFLSERGFSDPYSWARCFYKYNYIGPWVVFLLDGKSDGKREIYYEDRPAFDMVSCIGIRVGSIVEGSDVSGTPFEMMFPFDTDDFEKEFATLTSECEFYWYRDNSHWYTLQPHGHAKECWGEWEFNNVPEGVAESVKEMAEHIGYDYVDIPGHKGWTISRYYNDMTF